MFTKTTRARIFHGRRGFTLVEITLAMAVVAIGLVSILALFPLGLRATRSATDDTQMATVAQDYVSYYQQLALSTNNYTSSNLLANADYVSAATNDAIIYNVRVVVTNAGFPQMTYAGSNLLSRVIIQVWRSGARTNTYSTEVARYALP